MMYHSILMFQETKYFRVFGYIYYTVNMIIQCIVASACAKKGCVSQNIHVVNMVKLWIHSELICTETSALLRYTLLCSFLET